MYVLEGTDVLDAGVSFYMSTSSLAAGVGVLAEEYAPYCNAEGNDLREGDWTLPEAERFSQSFELKDTNILPNPTVMDSGGDFIYRPEAADAMKSELLKGHAIAITYYADQSMPEMSREDLRAMTADELILIFQSRVFGAPYDELVADAGRDGYLSFIGEDPVIYAQYTYQMEASNHAACRRTARQIGTKKCTFYKEE